MADVKQEIQQLSISLKELATNLGLSTNQVRDLMVGLDRVSAAKNASAGVRELSGQLDVLAKVLHEVHIATGNDLGISQFARVITNVSPQLNYFLNTLRQIKQVGALPVTPQATSFYDVYSPRFSSQMGNAKNVPFYQVPAAMQTYYRGQQGVEDLANQVRGNLPARATNIPAGLAQFATPSNPRLTAAESRKLTQAHRETTQAGWQDYLTSLSYRSNNIVAGRGGSPEPYGSGFVPSSPIIQPPMPVRGGGGQQASRFPYDSLESLANQLPGGMRAAKELEKTLQSMGMGLGNLNQTFESGSSGVSTWSAEVVKGDAVTKKAAGSVDAFGQVQLHTTARARTFGQQLAKNVVEMTKWTIAVTLVYAPFRALQDLIGQAIQNQTELAQILTVVNDKQLTLNEVFAAGVQAANAMGEEITGVLQGYTQAVRVTGDIEDKTLRYAKAQQILLDSLVLSKLSTLTQAEAMDTLVSTLRQVGEPLENASIYLDRWVAVTRIANVDLATLAQSFAIVGSAAQGAGIEVNGQVDNLSGLVAVLSEATTKSPTETGNALRAVITGLQSDAGANVLQEFGIAVEDSTGKLLGFYEITEQIYELYKRGIISDEDVSKISRAIGGGNRRQVDVEAVLKNIGEARRINQVASGDVGGSAYAALEIQLETVQTALTRLSNSFQTLAQTMGTDGGVLELVTDTTNGLTKLVDVVSSLISVVGRAGPALAALGALRFLAMSLPTSGKIASSALGSFFIGGMTGGPALEAGMGGKAGTQNFMQRNAGNLIYGAAGALGAGIPIAQNLARGNTQEAAGGGIGALIGGGIGAALGGPVGFSIGATLGQGIAESFVRNVITSEDDLGQEFAKRVIEAARAVNDPEADKEGSRTEFSSRVFQALGRAATAGGPTSKLLGSNESAEAYGSFVGWIGSLTGKGETKEDAALNQLQRFDPAVYQAFMQEEEARQAGLGQQDVLMDTPVTRRQEQLLSQFSGRLETFVNEQREKTQAGLVSGELSDREASATFDRLPSLDNWVTRTTAAAGVAFIELSDDADTAADAVMALSDLYLNSTDEQINVINRWVAEINRLEKQIEAAKKNGDGFIKTADGMEISLEEAGNQVTEFSNQVAGFAQNLILQQSLIEYVPPSVLDVGGINQGQSNTIAERARTLRDEELQALYQNDNQRTAAIMEYEPFKVRSGRDYLNVNQQVSQEQYRRAYDQLVGEGIIVPEVTNQKPSFQSFDFARGSSQDQAFNERYAFYDTLLESVGYQKDMVSTIELYSNAHIESNERDLLLVRLALQDILDVERKQLDGIYNLPTDATFWVPLAAAQLVRANANNNALGSSGSGIGNLTVEGEKEKVVNNRVIPQSDIGEYWDNFNDNFNRGAKGEKKFDRPLVMDTGGYDTEYPERSALSAMASAAKVMEGMKMSNHQVSPLTGSGLGAGVGLDFAGIIQQMLEAIQNLGSSEVKDVPSVRLELSLQSNFQTRLDGRVIANEIKNYVTQDLLRYSSGFNSVTRSISI